MGEFFTSLLEYVSSELPAQSNSTIIEEVYRKAVEESFICRLCQNHTSRRQDAPFITDIHMPSDTTKFNLEDLLVKIFENQIVEKSCDVCRNNGWTDNIVHDQVFKVIKMPEILIMQIMRNRCSTETGGINMKINASVTIENILSLNLNTT